MTELVTEMPRCFSTSIQSDVACRALLRALTVPASWIAPPNRSSFSVSVVLPASGCAMIANVRRLAIGAGSGVSDTMAESTHPRRRGATGRPGLLEAQAAVGARAADERRR